MTTAEVSKTFVPESIDLPFDLSTMQDEGVFVDIACTGFSCLRGSLSWRELGIDQSKVGMELSSPSCVLLPLEHAQGIKRMSSRAHSTLDAYAYRFLVANALFGSSSWRWMTWKAFKVFEGQFAQVRGDLGTAVQAVLDDYDAIRAHMEERASMLALSSAQRLAAGAVEMPAEFRQTVIDRVMDMVPTQQQLIDISVRYRVGALQLGSEILEEQRKALEERQKIESQAAWKGALSQDLQEELDTKRRIREMQLEAAQERISASLSPIDEAASQLHAAMFEGATAVLESLQKHEKVPASTAKKAREMAEQFRLMTWKSDEQLEQLLVSLQAAATKAEGSKTPLDPERLSMLAQDIAAHCYDVAKDASTITRMSQLEV